MCPPPRGPAGHTTPSIPVHAASAAAELLVPTVQGRGQNKGPPETGRTCIPGGEQGLAGTQQSPGLSSWATVGHRTQGLCREGVASLCCWICTAEGRDGASTGQADRSQALEYSHRPNGSGTGLSAFPLQTLRPSRGWGGVTIHSRPQTLGSKSRIISLLKCCLTEAQLFCSILRFYSFAPLYSAESPPLLCRGPLTLEAGFCTPCSAPNWRGHPKSRSRKHGHQNLV